MRQAACAGMDVMNIWTFLLFVISLGVLILIHELGHFAMAKLFNVYVKEFSIGFGPTLFKFKKGETQYSIRALPLGGYVAMVGEEADDPDITIPKERSLLGIKKYKRAIIMSAGIVLNFVLAFVLFFVSNVAFEQKEFRRDINVIDGSPAAVAGLVTSTADERILIDIEALDAGDIPVTLSGTSQQYYVKFMGFESYDDELIDGLVFSYMQAGERIVYTPATSGETASFMLPLATRLPDQDPVPFSVSITLTSIAVGDSFAFEDIGINLLHKFWYTFGESLQVAGQQWVEGTTLIARAIGGLFIGEGIGDVGGIIAIFNTSSSIFTNLGLGPYIYLWGLISVNLALFNLLPFPGLDGWHLLVISIEGIFRKEIPAKFKNIVSMIGLFILFGLMILLLFKDIIALF
jgi:regulator of sigma E protease